MVLKYIGLFLIAMAHIFVVAYGQNVDISLVGTSDGITLSIVNGTQTKLKGVLGKGRNFTGVDCIATGSPCQIDNIVLTVKLEPDGFRVTWISPDSADVFQDCFDLDIGQTNWYGGPERYVQEWPIEKLVLDGNNPYVIQKNDNFAVAERYWLNSQGVYIFLNDRVPLFIDQNTATVGQVCFIAKAQSPYINRERVYFDYYVGIMDNAKEAHLHAVNNYLGKPTGHPNENMIRKPVWTTWPKYKKYINESIVADFANQVYQHNFTGQIEIDEDWETCFGAHIFKPDLFGNISTIVQKIKSIGFTVTLWINPFVNSDCEDFNTIGLEKGYFVKNPEGNTTAIWWESSDAHQIDYTKPEAAQWFADRIRVLMQDPGVDGFKFDAGETDYAIPPSQYDNVDQELVPNILTQSYIETCSQFGDLIEVRSAFRTQKYPFFVRMIDKDSIWPSDNGLYTLVTTLLQMNMNGYGMVLPDMIGGNGYRAQPTAELIVRWTQANALMPTMQFGYLPWDYPSPDFDTTEIARKFVKLHEDFAEEILRAMENSISNGIPVNPPIWWLDPADKIALQSADEFLLGENILVAPVLTENTQSRDVYLPSGSWRDPVNGNVFQGPITITDYPAPIDVLPYFIKQ